MPSTHYHCLSLIIRILLIQVKSNFRSSITIPEKSWSRFRDVFSDYVDKMNEVSEKPSGATNSGSQSGDVSGTAQSNTGTGGGGGGVTSITSK